jgi:DNA polymerase epsilon subunit 1
VGAEALGGEVENPVVCQPGVFRSVCCELGVEHLAVNAVRHSDLVNELDFAGDDGGGGLQSGDGGDAGGECSRAFRVLKGMMGLWFEQAVGTQDVMADALLAGAYRWLASSKSLLHDPALHRCVHSLMKKLFLQLLAQVRALGGTVVFANFVSLTVATNKVCRSCCRRRANAASQMDLATGEAYVEHFRRTLQAKPLFANVGLRPYRFWLSHIFMDPANFGGVDETGQAADGAWNLAAYLPATLGEPFVNFVAEFMFRPHKLRERTLQRVEERARKRVAMDDDDGEPAALEVQVREEEVGAGPRRRRRSLAPAANASQERFLRELVGSDFAKRLLRALPDATRDSIGPDWFPRLPGSHLRLHHPALEFAKSLCFVLGLDPVVEEQVRMLKRVLLKQCRTPEFSPEAEFRNPALSLVLNDVVCGACGVCEDVDMCRDPRLVKPGGGAGGEGGGEDEVRLGRPALP